MDLLLPFTPPRKCLEVTEDQTTNECQVGYLRFTLLSLALASCLINAQSLPAHCLAADELQMIGHCPVQRAVPVPISLTAYAHFGAHLGAFFY